MVERVPSIGTPRAPRADVTERAATEPLAGPRVWIVEDEPAAAALAADMCQASGAAVEVFHAPVPFLAALRAGVQPDAAVLDWRLERELSAALFLATRHRFPELPVIYWTGSAPGELPAMIREDAFTRVIDKAAGSRAFEAAVAWALGTAA